MSNATTMDRSCIPVALDAKVYIKRTLHDVQQNRLHTS